ncbi:MAG: porin [Opitutaceae bacterium]|nr:porin [Opitutaceae bacterium]
MNVRHFLSTKPATFLAFSLAVTSTRLLGDASSDEIAALREQIRQLDQKLRVLERKTEIAEEDAAAKAKTNAKLTVTDRGVTLASADGGTTLRLRGLVQGDSRWYLNDGGIGNNDAFILRRARIIAEGTFNKIFEYQVVPEFGGSAVSVLDANLNVNLKPGFQVRVGKFKTPVGLEQLQSDSFAFFTERSFVSQLVPNRDLGVQVWGDLYDGRLSYAVGAFNGVGDGGSSNNADFDDEKDVAVRLFAQPFKNDAGSFLQGLGVGVAASYGDEETASALTGGYRTDGQQRFFAYNSGVVGDGKIWRISPQAYYYNGPLGVLAEYVESTANVRTATSAKKELTNKAWQVAVGYVLTGEDSSYRGVSPAKNFNLSEGSCGAFEVVARVSHLDVDDASFPVFASASASATEALAYGAGVNWYLSKAVRLTADYFHTDFDYAPGTPASPSNAVIRQDENSIITRLQLTF